METVLKTKNCTQWTACKSAGIFQQWSYIHVRNTPKNVHINNSLNIRLLPYLDNFFSFYINLF